MTVLEMLSNFIFPSVCKFCGETISYDTELCASCKKHLAPIKGIVCCICGKEKGFCRCESETFLFDRCIAPFYYEGIAKKGVATLKYGGISFIAKYQSRYMVRRIKKEYKAIAFDIAVSVPMYRLKQRKRGYNQAEVLTRHIAKALFIPFGKNLLLQVKQNEAQHIKTRAERVKNVQGIYKLNNRLSVRNKTVLLVDDIFTTGATLNECTRILKDNGAKKVYCAVFCTTKPIKA